MSSEEEIKTVNRVIFAMHDKPERVKALFMVRDQVSPEALATVFGDVWTNSESLFANQLELAALLHRVRETGTADLAMSAVERTRLRMLKQKGKVTLYRGAANNNRKGYSWTTKRETAVWFAKRNALDGQPVLVRAEFDASDLVFCFNGRNEFEVVVDLFSDTAQASMLAAKVTLLPKIEVHPTQHLYHNIQTTASNDLLETGPRLLMTIVNMRANRYELDRVAASLEEDAALLDRYGLTEKAAQYRQRIENIREMWDASEVEIMLDQMRKAPHYAI